MALLRAGQGLFGGFAKHALNCLCMEHLCAGHKDEPSGGGGWGSYSVAEGTSLVVCTWKERNVDLEKHRTKESWLGLEKADSRKEAVS